MLPRRIGDSHEHVGMRIFKKEKGLRPSQDERDKRRGRFGSCRLAQIGQSDSTAQTIPILMRGFQSGICFICGFITTTTTLMRRSVPPRNAWRMDCSTPAASIRSRSYAIDESGTWTVNTPRLSEANLVFLQNWDGTCSSHISLSWPSFLNGFSHSRLNCAGRKSPSTRVRSRRMARPV